ncbi:MAG: transposase [Actinobacteria bacterium]|nr:transposase [Actinomycetota bacterium]
MTQTASPPWTTPISGIVEPTAQLRGFRAGFYDCWTGWADAGFELCEAVLCAPAPVASVPMLSLEPCFRRSHGSLYKALDRGGLDTEAIRDLLAAHRPEDWPLVFAVDASIWARCDAETSAQRGFYYSASKHSAGQPIVAGWSYQWITALDWAHDSWTAPMDATRIPPDTDAVSATATQIRALTTRLTQTQPTRRPETDVCLRRRLRPDRADLRTGRHRGQHGGPDPR